ncbi:MAG: hypothetical protein SGILL_005566, partial [Bacillariaceae sp.]
MVMATRMTRSVERYALLVVLLAVAHFLSLSYIIFTTKSKEMMVRDGIVEIRQQQNFDAPLDATATLAEEQVEVEEKEQPPPLQISNIQVGGRRSHRQEIHRLSPPNMAKTDATLQLDEKTVVVVGGFVDNYQNVSATIQFFDIRSQTWTKSIKLPDNVAETHQGLVYEQHQRILYIVSGQKGSGCMPATTSVVRYWIDTDIFDELPPLPEARYSPGVEIVRNPLKPNVSYLHVFGGAGINRKFGARNHWGLVIDDDDDNSQAPKNLKWEALESLPDAGVHGASFLTSDGYIHYTGYCQLDQGVVESSRMSDCHENAVRTGQMLHHVSDVGLTFRYPAVMMPKQNAHWERVTDMPFPACHGGGLFDDSTDTFYYVGGGLTNTQIKQGSAPKSLSMIQIYFARKKQWQVFAFAGPPRSSHLFSLISWVDKERQQLVSIHPGSTMIAANLTRTSFTTAKGNTDWLDVTESYFQRTRVLSIQANEDHDQYNRLRGTWNEQHRKLHYPDIVALPRTTKDVSYL